MAIEQKGKLINQRVAPITIGPEFIDIYDHLNYLGYDIYFERQRSGLLAARGLSFQSILDDYNLQIVAGKRETNWVRSARAGDQVVIDTQVFNRAFVLRFIQTMQDEEGVLATSDMRSAFIDASTLRPVRALPDKLLGILSLPEDQLPEEMRLLEGRETFPYPKNPYS